MFIEENDLPNVIYGYQVEQITEGDNSIVLQALNAAEHEARSYLTPNNKNDYLDGRLIYDVETIFNQEGKNRNPLLLQHTITIAKWYIVDLSNVDIIYEHAKERYDRATEWLSKLATGEVNLSTLPLLESVLTEDDNGSDRTPWSMGSRKKFNHDI